MSESDDVPSPDAFADLLVQDQTTGERYDVSVCTFHPHDCLKLVPRHTVGMDQHHSPAEVQELIDGKRGLTVLQGDPGV